MAGPTHAAPRPVDAAVPADPADAHRSAPLSVGFDGRALSSPAGGVRRYAGELFAAMAALPGLRVTAVAPAAAAAVPAGVARGAAAPSLPTNAGWMLSGLPLAARRLALDVFHAPAYTAPLFPPRPLILTIHDVSYARHPEWYPYRRDPWRRLFYRLSARTADRIITDSAFSRDEICEAFALERQRIAVVPLAPAARFTPGQVRGLPAGLPPRFLLHVGDLHARRNLGVVQAALTRLRQRRPDLSEISLVLAGVPREQASECATTRHALALGAVDDEMLVALYRAAAALLYPSRYEGFGLPILEAMASGLPVLASDASCIPETAGDAAILIDPDDVEGWSEAIERVLDDAPWASELRARGLAHASRFSWTRTARETVAVYRAALTGA